MARGAKIVRDGGIKFPKVTINSPHPGKGSYKAFLNSLVHIPGNQRAFAVINKAKIDAEFERQLRDALQTESLVQRFMREDARSKQAEAHFSELQTRTFGKMKLVLAADDAQSLDLPPMFTQPNSGKYGVYERQTYADFAAKTEKKNPGVELSKAKMDLIFESVARRINRNVKAGQASPEQFERMMSRWLGKESEDYWKKR